MPSDRSAKKSEYFTRLIQLLEDHTQILIVHADHVGSCQMQNVRKALRGKAELLMGKNTMIRKVIRGHLNKMPQLERLLPHVRENIGFVFCKGDLAEIRKIIIDNKVPAPARAGVIAPCDVIVPPGPTGLDPSQTSFFQALNIATKINKGQIEILNPVHLIHKDSKVGNSEVALLNKLDIKPFSYGLVIRTVYDDGSIFDPEVLDLTEDDLVQKFMNGVSNVAALSRAVGLPTTAALPHIMLDGFKNLVALILDTEFSFKQADALKNAIKNPGAFAAAAAPAAGAAPAAAEAPKKEEKVEEEEEDAGVGGLFGDDGW